MVVSGIYWVRYVLNFAQCFFPSLTWLPQSLKSARGSRSRPSSWFRWTRRLPRSEVSALAGARPRSCPSPPSVTTDRSLGPCVPRFPRLINEHHSSVDIREPLEDQTPRHRTQSAQRLACRVASLRSMNDVIPRLSPLPSHRP